MTYAYPTVHDYVWTYIRAGAEQCRSGTFVHVGCHLHAGRWILTSPTRNDPKLMSAVKFFGENHLQLNNVVAARIGKGLRDLPAIKGYDSSIVVIWRPGSTYKQFIEPSNAGQYVVDRVRFDLE